MTTGEIVDTSLRLYQRLGMTFLRVSAVPALLCLASIAFLGAFVLPGLFANDNGSFVTHLGEVGLALSLGLLIGGPLFLSGLAYDTGVVVSLVSDWLLGNAVDINAAEETARRTMPRLLLVQMRELLLAFSGVVAATAIIALGEWVSTVTPESDFWAGIIALLGVVGLIVGIVFFLWIVARDGIVAPVTILENLGPADAGKRSRDLLKRAPFHPSGTGVMWALYALLFFFALVMLGGIYGSARLTGLDDAIDRLTSGILFGPLIQQAFDLLPWFLTIWTLLPVWATTATILYFDRRVRLEGFDIEVLGRDLAHNAPTSRLQL